MPSAAIDTRIRTSFDRQGLMQTLAKTEMFAETAGQLRLIALLTTTLMTLRGREGVAD